MLEETQEFPKGNSLSAAAARQLTQCCDGFSAAWNAGDTPGMEDYLAHCPQEADRAVLFYELLMIELDKRTSMGEQFAEEEYIRRFPDCAATIRKAFADRKASVSTCDAGRTADESGPGDIAVDATTLTRFICLSHGESPKVPAVKAGVIDPGTLLGDRYQIDKELGRGGMGRVYLAHDLRLERPVAIKVIAWTSAAAKSDRLAMRRAFEQEAKIGAGLVHPSIATVHDYGFHHDTAYTVFEFVGGETLREIIRSNSPMPLADVQFIIASLAQALDYAHSKGIVHRDLKPENIRFTEQGQVKVLDLGLALRFHDAQHWRFVGTPAYASPEQAAERPTDGRTDQYALAIIAYEMLTGQRPFQSGSILDLLKMQLTQPIEPVLASTTVDLPDAVCASLKRALQKDPVDRFGTCDEFAAAMGCQFFSIASKQSRVLLSSTIKVEESLWRWISRTIGGRNWLFGWVLRWLVSWMAKTPAEIVLLENELWLAQRLKRIESWPRSVDITFMHRYGRRLEVELNLEHVRRRYDFTFDSEEVASTWQEALIGWSSSPSTANSRLSAAQDLNHVTVREHSWACPLSMRPCTSHQVLGSVDAQRTRKPAAMWQLQTKATMQGAHAIFDISGEKVFGPRGIEWRYQGLMIRAIDSAGQSLLTWQWCGQLAGRLATLKVALVVTCLLGMGWAMLAAGGYPQRVSSSHAAVYAAAVGVWPVLSSLLLEHVLTVTWLRAIKLNIIGLVFCQHSVLIAMLIANDENPLEISFIRPLFLAWLVAAYWVPSHLWMQASIAQRALRPIRSPKRFWNSAVDCMAMILSVVYLLAMAAAFIACIYPGLPW